MPFSFKNASLPLSLAALLSASQGGSLAVAAPFVVAQAEQTQTEDPGHTPSAPSQQDEKAQGEASTPPAAQEGEQSRPTPRAHSGPSGKHHSSGPERQERSHGDHRPSGEKSRTEDPGDPPRKASEEPTSAPPSAPLAEQPAPGKESTAPAEKKQIDKPQALETAPPLGAPGTQGHNAKAPGMGRDKGRKVDEEDRPERSHGSERGETRAAPSPRDKGGAVSSSETRARNFLSQDRGKKTLTTPELQVRVTTGRELLESKDLSPQTRATLQIQFEKDREALRTSVSMERERSSGSAHKDDRRKSLGEVMSDRRPSHTLGERDLRERISKLNALLSGTKLSGMQRREVGDLLQSDRRALAKHLKNDRKKRHERREDRGISIHIGIANDRQKPHHPKRDIYAEEVDEEALIRQLTAPPTRAFSRRYSLKEIERTGSLRDAMPGVEITSIHFGFGETMVREEEIDYLEEVGLVMERIVAKNPHEVFLIEGHTDAVGSASSNARLSLQRARSVRRALLEYFDISPDNLEAIGYGERFLKIPTPHEEPENRRVTIRRITPLLDR